jgi:hypothetical protein
VSASEASADGSALTSDGSAESSALLMPSVVVSVVVD